MFEFGPFLVDDRRRRLLRGEDLTPVPVSPKAFDLLLCLLKHPGTLVPKRDLLRAVWPSTMVGSNSLDQSVSALRRALGERPGQHDYIVTDPGRGYRFVAAVTRRADLPASGALAVLPFRRLEPAAEDVALQLGMVEALCTRLATIPGLTLAPLSSVRVAAGETAEPVTVGRKLGAAYVLDGALTIVDDTLRVEVRLLDVATERDLWSDRFDAPLAQVFTVQDRISERTAAAVAGALTPVQRRRMRRHPTENADAYQYFVSGWSRLTRPSSATLPLAIADLERAVALDPDFSLAHACLADGYAVLAVFGGGAPHDLFPRARTAVSRALELDPMLAEAHAELGHIQMVYELDMDGAERSFQCALEIDQSSTMALHYTGLLSIVRGRLDEALDHIRAAQQLEPLALNFNANIGMVHYYARRYDVAARTLETTLAMEPSFDHARTMLGRTYVRLGRHDEALQHFHARIGTTVGSAADVGVASALGGRTAAARAEIADLLARSRTGYVSAFDVASIQAALGDHRAALLSLESALEQRAQPLMFLSVDPTFDQLRSDPRFERIRRRATGG